MVQACQTEQRRTGVGAGRHEVPEGLVAGINDDLPHGSQAPGLRQHVPNLQGHTPVNAGAHAEKWQGTAHVRMMSSCIVMTDVCGILWYAYPYGSRICDYKHFCTCCGNSSPALQAAKCRGRCV